MKCGKGDGRVASGPPRVGTSKPHSEANDRCRRHSDLVDEKLAQALAPLLRDVEATAGISVKVDDQESHH
jgi:hypothetical protein